jgi:TRAP-type uncharacterized transport system substrate-binding protein
MTRAPTPGGVAGVWLVICTAALAAGLAFDFMTAHPAPFWIAAGAGAAVYAIVAGHVARLLLRPPLAKGTGDVRDHA